MTRAIWAGRLSSAIAFVLLVGCAAPLTAVPPAAPYPGPTMIKSTGGKLSARLEMLTSSPALRAASTGEQARALSLPPSGPGSLVRDAQGRVLVNIRLADVSPPSLQSLRDVGAVITMVAEPYQQVTAFVAVTDLIAIANLSIVLNVQEQLAPLTSGGGVVPYPP